MKAYSHMRIRRRGLSELTATVLTIAITLIAGFAVFSYINSQANVSESQYGQAVAGAVDSVRESFVIIDMSVNNTCGTGDSMWIYNNGEVSLKIVQVLLYDTKDPSKNATLTVPSATIAPQAPPMHLPFSVPSPLCPFKSGDTYLVKVTGYYGNVESYYTVAP